MDTKNVIISIVGSQREQGGYDDTVELLTNGEFFFENGQGSFSYMESELTGLEGTKTTFSFGPLGVTLNREGSVNSQMFFEEGRKHNFLYDTPFGSATMGVNTKRIMLGMDEHGGDLEIDYLVDYQQSVIGQNKFKINVREQKEGN
ncbi:MAG: DUF1934 domain-containing protein [Clostridia bacterium]|nr:DUF1934 domain-containing protein [Clostridia bacterium]